MTSTITRQRIEVLVDSPLVQRILDAAKSAGVTGYTMLPTLGGLGQGGHWADDQVSGAASKVLFITVTNEKKAAALIDALTPLLESHSFVLFRSNVEVVRGERF